MASQYIASRPRTLPLELPTAYCPFPPPNTIVSNHNNHSSRRWP